MRILVADSLPDACVEALRTDGHDVETDASLDAGSLPGRLDHDVLVVRSTRVTAEALAACARLALVVRAGSGTNTIDVEAAADRGVVVSNVPGGNADAVAELTIGLLLAVDRRIPDAVADIRAGRWRKSAYQKARGLKGRSIGIVGLGEIGLGVAERAAALGMEVLGVERAGRDQATLERLERVGVRLAADLEALVAASDVVSLHLPATPGTRGILGRDLLARVRPGTIILNTARGDLVDDEALLEVIDDKELFVGIDVHRDEPSAGEAEFRSALAAHPRVYATHHIGASTEQAQQAIAAEVVEVVRAFVRGESRSAVNLEERLRGTTTVVIRHENKVGVLARVLDLLSAAELNVEQMENEIMAGGGAARATIRLGGELGPDVSASIAALPEVIHVGVVDAT